MMPLRYAQKKHRQLSEIDAGQAGCLSESNDPAQSCSSLGSSREGKMAPSTPACKHSQHKRREAPAHLLHLFLRLWRLQIHPAVLL